jgi:FkbM family methyltransferase
MDKKRFVRLVLVKPLTAVLGRRKMYRFSRFLLDESRREAPWPFESFTSDGEKMVQATVLRHSVDPVVFDVGANVGDWTASLLGLASHMKAAVTVHAFEPCSGTLHQLRKRIEQEQWRNVTAVPKACAAAPGTAAMTVYWDGCGINTIAEPIEYLASAHQEIVELTSLDVYCSNHSIKHIDLLKIDAEGYDFECILGASGLLTRKAIDVLQFEYNERWIGTRHYLRDVFNLVKPLGYAIGKITPEGVEFYAEWHWELETCRGGNYICCTQDWLTRFARLDPTWLAYRRLDQLKRD